MKKLIKTLSVIVAVFGLTFSVQSQTKDTVVIKTSSQCEQCKDRIESALAYEKGVVSSDLNIKTKEVTVVYKSNKTTPEKIRMAISKVGYDADDVLADPNAYEKLPACCKKGGHDHHNHNHDH